MKVSKTRAQIVGTARKLFAEKGLAATTMNDIAAESGKGRRTLYTYFGNKEEVYVAVIEEELSILTEGLNHVVKKHINPERKLIEYIFTRLDTIREIVQRNGTLKSEFFKNITEVAKARKKIDSIEISNIRKILEEGIEKGNFRIENVETATLIIHYALQGIEAPYTKTFIREKMRHNRNSIVRFLLKGLK